jgi:hypothetical protein
MKWISIDLRRRRGDFGLTADRKIVNRIILRIVKAVLRASRQACDRNQQNQDGQLREQSVTSISQL